LVDPPMAISTLMAFSKAVRVMMSLAFTPLFSNSMTANPLSKATRLFLANTAGAVAQPGMDMPRASVIQAMVLAV